MSEILKYVIAALIPEVVGVAATVPAVRWYIRRKETTRFCANCQKPLRPQPRRTHATEHGLTIIEG